MATQTSSGLSSWEDAVLWLREQPDRQDLVRAAYYDDPLHDAALRYWRSDEWQAIRALLRPATQGAHVRALDAGAGRGIASFALAKDGFDVTALEPDSSAIVGAEAIRQLARDSGFAIRVEQTFSEQLPFDDRSFDVVFARAVLHHTKDLSAACREFFRVLKPGGRLVAVREHVISKPEDLPAFFDIHPLHHLYGGENAFLLAQYTDAIGTAGFAIEHVLAPLESPINLAPHSVATLCAELAQRAAPGRPALAGAVRSVLHVPGVWPVARRVLQHFDHRPGRLYSFVAVRP